MLSTRDDEFHVFVPNRLDTGFSRELCEGDCDVDLDITAASNAIPHPDIYNLVTGGPWKDREERGAYLVVTNAKVAKNEKGKIDRTLVIDFYKANEDGSRSTYKIKTEKYVNGRRVK